MKRRRPTHFRSEYLDGSCHVNDCSSQLQDTRSFALLVETINTESLYDGSITIHEHRDPLRLEMLIAKIKFWTLGWAMVAVEYLKVDMGLKNPRTVAGWIKFCDGTRKEHLVRSFVRSKYHDRNINWYYHCNG